MKKNVTILLLIIICVFFYILGFCTYSHRNNISHENTTEYKIDYPLIEIPFDDKNEWLVIVRQNMFTEQEKYYVSKNSKELHINKENIILSTFPVGRGTTPNGVVYVYKNKELFKEIPYIEIFFENNIIKRTFEYISKEEINELINTPIPPPI